MLKSDLSHRLKLYLELSGMTQKGLAQISRVPESVISRVVRGENNMSIDNLVKIASATGVNSSWLLGYGSDDYITPNF